MLKSLMLSKWFMVSFDPLVFVYSFCQADFDFELDVDPSNTGSVDYEQFLEISEFFSS